MWAPRASSTVGPQCSNCNTTVSHQFFRVWSVDGELNGCPKCKSRTQRYSNNPVIDPEGEERDPL